MPAGTLHPERHLEGGATVDTMGKMEIRSRTRQLSQIEGKNRSVSSAIPFRYPRGMSRPDRHIRSPTGESSLFRQVAMRFLRSPRCRRTKTSRVFLFYKKRI